MKTSKTMILALGLSLFAFPFTRNRLGASPEHPNVQSYSGGGWASAPSGETSFDRITTFAQGSIQYWLFWEEINGKWTLLFRIRRAPPDPSVSTEEADTLNNAYSNKSKGTISVHHGNGGSSLEGAMEFPGEITPGSGTIGK